MRSIRLASLWLAQGARIAADNALRVYVMLLAMASGDARWQVLALILVLPSLVLAPVIGAKTNSLSPRLVLTGSAALCLAAVLLLGWNEVAWPWWMALAAINAALFSAARYAVLPAAGRDTHTPLVRLLSWIEMGTAAAVAFGLLLGSRYLTVSWGDPQVPAWLSPLARSDRPVLLVFIALLNGVSVVAALPVRFADDVSKREGVLPALTGFFRAASSILRGGEARSSLIASALLRGLALTILATLLLPIGSSAHSEMIMWWRPGLLILAGAACGCLLGGIQAHPTRMLGAIPVGCLGLTIGLLATVLFFAPTARGEGLPDLLCLFLGAMGGLINVSLLACYQLNLPAEARGHGMALLNGLTCVALAALWPAALHLLSAIAPATLLWMAVVIALVCTVIAWRVLLRDGVEYVTEMMIWPFFRVHGHGPGLDAVPRRGPLIVVANHSAWCDPMWLAKILPRRLVPMLTSMFYDIPVLRTLVSVAHTIRVEVSRFRKDAPELKEAVAALDRGDTLLIFPEGQMRKAADIPLRPFGRGVWRILQERPDTPVVVCWIEGGWGSFTSYFKGTPTKNKKPDFWRRIDVAVAAPQVLDADMLKDHRATRTFLANECLQARRFMGLEPLPMPTYFGVHHDEDDDEHHGEDHAVKSST
ncbi:MAG: MFS transporter [Gemmataceae bacterium]